MHGKGLKELLRRKSQRTPQRKDEVWVHPELNRVLKGSDYKLASDEAERYWMDRKSQRSERE